jgi:three-Cys-motif partner protein
VHPSLPSVNRKRGVFQQPVNVLPPFREHFLIDLSGKKVQQLRAIVRDRKDVHILQGDCNSVLLEDVFPQVKYEDYRRGLCLLDPYGLHLDWKVLATAGQMKTIDLFLNFPTMDINMNALWHPVKGRPADTSRMTRFWGDDSWRQAAYRPSKQSELFSESAIEKVANPDVAEAFRKRLQNVAGFAFVPDPMPMRNSKNAIVYYLFFASQNRAGSKIVSEIFATHRDRRS